jgi:uncharacterized protein (TIGR03083 family)
VDSAEYLDAIRTNADALLVAADSAGLDAPVPTCPEWVVADLLGHVGRVHRWAAGNARRAPGDDFWPGAEIEIPEPRERPAWVRAGAAELVAALDRSEDAPAWTWLPPPTVGFWQRRQAHETAMHRVDAQAAVGAPEPIDAALAADGIDEWLVIVGNTPWREPPKGAGETLHFHCTDVEGEWLVRRAPDGIVVERVHAKGDVAARGTASDLLCWLQGRAPVDRLEVFGDADLLTQWRADATF